MNTIIIVKDLSGKTHKIPVTSVLFAAEFDEAEYTRIKTQIKLLNGTCIYTADTIDNIHSVCTKFF